MPRDHHTPSPEVGSTPEAKNHDLSPVVPYIIGGLALDGYAIDLVFQPNIIGHVAALGLASLATAAFIRARHLYNGLGETIRD